MKLTINHNIGGGDISAQWLRKFLPPVIVQTGEFRPELAAPVTIGRIGDNYPCSAQSWKTLSDADAAGARYAIDIVYPLARANPHVTHWESPNEPEWRPDYETGILRDQRAIPATQLYAAFHAGYAVSCYSLGIEPAIGAWAVRSPGNRSLRTWAAEVGRYLRSRPPLFTVHAYGVGMQDFADPIRAIADGLRAAGIDPTRKIVSTESGREWIGGKGGPWKTADELAHAPDREAAYAAELGAIGEWCGRMPEVLGAAVYLAGGPDQWKDYRLTPKVVDLIPQPQLAEIRSTAAPANNKPLITWHRSSTSRAVRVWSIPGIGPGYTLTAPWDIDVFDQAGAWLAITASRGYWVPESEIFGK